MPRPNYTGETDLTASKHHRRHIRAGSRPLFSCPLLSTAAIPSFPRSKTGPIIPSPTLAQCHINQWEGIRRSRPLNRMPTQVTPSSTHRHRHLRQPSIPNNNSSNSNSSSSSSSRASIPDLAYLINSNSNIQDNPLLRQLPSRHHILLQINHLLLSHLVCPDLSILIRKTSPIIPIPPPTAPQAVVALLTHLKVRKSCLFLSSALCSFFFFFLLLGTHRCLLLASKFTRFQALLAYH